MLHLIYKSANAMSMGFNENGADVGPSQVIWSGSKNDGTNGGLPTCTDWSSTTGTGEVGQSGVASSWLDVFGTNACSGTNHLLCINQ